MTNGADASQRSDRLLQAREFLSKAIAWPANDNDGYVNIHTLKPDREGMGGQAFQSLEAAIAFIQWQLSQDANVYVCMSKQREAKPTTNKLGHPYYRAIRNQANAVALKSLYVDLDVGPEDNKYDTFEEMQTEVLRFIKETGLPRPTYGVCSGNGGHLHWIFNRALMPEEYLSLAYAIVEAFKQHGVKCDGVCTTDTARVLRIPGTFNHKTTPAKPVTQWFPYSKEYSYADIDAILSPYKIAIPQGAASKSIVSYFENPALFTPQSLPSVFTKVDNSACSAGIETAMPQDEIRSCLNIIPNNKTDWNFWNTIGMRVYAASEGRDYGLEEWERWSAKNAAAIAVGKDNCADRWATFHTCPPTHTGAGALVNEARTATGDPKWMPSQPPQQNYPESNTATDPLRFINLSLEEAVKRINAEYLVLRSTGTIYRQGPEGELTALSQQHLATALGGRWVTSTDDKAEAKPAAKAWMSSPSRREYRGFQYCPNGIGLKPGSLNLWTGWGEIQPYSGDCSFVIDHILHVVAGGDRAKADFLVNWLADILQNPLRKPGVCVVLRGDEGTGKSVIGAIMRRILGAKNVLTTSDHKRILAQFNTAVMNKILVLGEEMLFAGDHATADKLKHFITGQTMSVEFKFGDVLEIDSYHRLLLTSNHEQVIQASGLARRFVIFDVSDARRGDADYFDKLYAVADGRSHAAAAAFMQYLLDRDLKNFQPWAAQQALASDMALARQKTLSLSPPLQWLREVIDNVVGQGPSGSYNWEDGLPFLSHAPGQGQGRESRWPPEFPRGEAVAAFRNWLRNVKPYGASEYTGEERFWREIFRVIPRVHTTHQNSSGQRLVRINLVDVQANFEKHLRGETV